MISISLNISLISMGGADGITRPCTFNSVPITFNSVVPISTLVPSSLVLHSLVPSSLVLRTFNSCTLFLFNSSTFKSITFNSCSSTFNSLARSVPSHVINFSDSTGICSDSITSSNILLPALNSSEEIS